MTEIQELYQQLIIDHGRHPRHFGKMENADVCKQGVNPLCGDKLTLYLQWQAGKIHKACFYGSGCAISIASASLMIEAILGLAVDEVDNLFTNFHELLTQEHSDEQAQLKLGKLMALAGVKAFPMRVKCATLAWHTLHAAVHHVEGDIQTE